VVADLEAVDVLAAVALAAVAVHADHASRIQNRARAIWWRK
jgi:hypothetical protein